MIILLLWSVLAGAVVIGPVDRRMTEADLARQEKWPAAKVRRLLHAAGSIHCPWTRASAALVGSRRTLVTAAHVFFDKNGRWIGSPAACVFKNFASSPVEHRLEAATGTYAHGDMGPPLRRAEDWFVARLEQPVSEAEPFPLYGGVPAEGSALLNISRLQGDLAGRLSPAAAVVQSCLLRRLVPGLFLTDCAGDHGSSGSILLVEASGDWTAVAIVKGGPPAALNGMPFDPMKVATTAVPLWPRASQALQWLSR